MIACIVDNLPAICWGALLLLIGIGLFTVWPIRPMRWPSDEVSSARQRRRDRAERVRRAARQARRDAAEDRWS